MKKRIITAVLAFCFMVGAACPALGQEYSVADVENMLLGNEIDENLAYAEASTVPFEVRAKAAVLMDAGSGKVLMAMNENESLFPASVTKIMSMLLFCEAIDSGSIALEDMVTVSETAAAKGGSQIWLEPGETMSVHDLLKATAVYSANDACAALGEHIAGSSEAFVTMMNKKASDLHMGNTHFENCTGLDDDTDSHLTTAYDVAVMSRALLQHSFITEYTTIWMDTLRDGKTELVNTNKLVRFYTGATGLKTGTTAKAGCCVSASAQRGGLHLIAVVMGSDNSQDRFNGAKEMLNWGFANFESFTPEIDESLVAPVRVMHGLQQSIIPVCDGSTQSVLLRKGGGAEVTQEVAMETAVEAPVEAGAILGRITFSLEGETVAEVRLVAPETVERLTLFSALGLLLRAFAKQE